MNYIPARIHHHAFALSCVMLGLILANGCATPRTPGVLQPSDAEMGRLAQQAQSLFAQQRPAQAAALYQAALDRARALDDDAAIARLAYNLGACRLESGDVRGATAALEEAIHAAGVAGLPREEAQLLLGYALLQQGETDRTLALCGQVLKAPGWRADSDMRLRFQLLQAEAFLQADQIDRAEETLRETVQQLAPKSASALQAQAAHIEGALLSRRGHPSESGQAYLRAAALWRAANRPMDVAAALVHAADQQQRAQEIPATADSRYRAARALLGLGRPAEADTQLDRLEALPQKEWPESLPTLVPLIRQEIARRTPVQTDRKAAQP